jgi:hypothetical protein
LRRRIESRQALGGEISEWLEIDDPPHIGEHQTAPSIATKSSMLRALPNWRGNASPRSRRCPHGLVNVKDDPHPLRRQTRGRALLRNSVAAGGDGKGSAGRRRISGQRTARRRLAQAR